MAERQLSDARPDGHVLGQSATDKLAFHGADPVVQAAAITNIANDASGTLIATAVNSILVALRNKGIIAS